MKLLIRWSKDVIAFIIALYQLFLPLVIALLVTGALIVVIFRYLF